MPDADDPSAESSRSGPLAVLQTKLGNLLAPVDPSFLVVHQTRMGTLLFGVGSFGIQPERPKRDGQLVDLDSGEPNRFEDRIQELPPLRGERLPFSDRVDRNVKLFVTAIAVLAVSAALEFVFGVPG